MEEKLTTPPACEKCGDMMMKNKVYTYRCKWFRSGSDCFEMSTGRLYSSYSKASKAMNEEVDRLQKCKARVMSYNVVEREIF